MMYSPKAEKIHVAQVLIDAIGSTKTFYCTQHTLDLVKEEAKRLREKFPKYYSFIDNAVKRFIVMADDDVISVPVVIYDEDVPSDFHVLKKNKGRHYVVDKH